MKKVSGTLKLDQAQFRELEAFAKFGSDLDAATKLTIERGKRNLEILKQPAFSPVSVEHQVALIYISTSGLLDSVPVNQVKNFEKEFLNLLTLQHAATLADIKKGKIDDSITSVLKKVSNELSSRYSNK